MNTNETTKMDTYFMSSKNGAHAAEMSTTRQLREQRNTTSDASQTTYLSANANFRR